MNRDYTEVEARARAAEEIRLRAHDVLGVFRRTMLCCNHLDVTEAQCSAVQAALAADATALVESTKARDVWCAEASASRDHLDRLRTIVDEAFGMRPVESAEETLTALESGLFTWRSERDGLAAEIERLRGEVKAVALRVVGAFEAVAKEVRDDCNVTGAT